MQTSIEGSSERRKSATPRIPVDLLVELCAAEEPRHEARRGERKLDSWSDVSEAFGESYDADGLDLSATGLRLRSAVLPDVGQRLRCRFDLPDTDAKCEAEGRVVWSNDSGRHGEFGLRFDSLAPAVESALARWAMDRGPTTLPGTEPAPQTDASAPRDKRDARLLEAEARIAEARLSEARATEARATEARATEARRTEARPTEARATERMRQPFGIAKVRFDGVSSAIEAEISVRDELRLDVAQALPFFELGRLASVEADGSTERRRLEHVSLRIENGVPKLILGLVAEISSSAGTVAAPSMDAESTIQDEAIDELLAKSSKPASRAVSEERVVEARSSMAPSSPGGAWVTGDEDSASDDDAALASATDDESTDDESTDESTDEALEARGEQSKQARKDKEKSRKRPLFGANEDSLDDADPRVQADRKKKLDEVRRVLLDGEELPEAPTSSAGAEPAATGLALDRVKSKARAMGAALQPTLSRLTTALRTGWAAFVAGVGPRSKAAYAAVAGWIARVASLVSERVRDRAPRLASMLTRSPAKEKRRSTAAPVASTQAAASPRRQRQSQTGAQALQSAPAAEVVAARPRLPLRWVLLGVIALGAVGSLAYAFGGGSAEPAPIVVPETGGPETSPSTETSTTGDEPAAVGVESAALLAPPAPAATDTTSTTTSTSARSLVAAPAGEPSALSAPSTDEGRLPMPGYPSIGRASDTRVTSASSTSSGTTPSAAASAVGPTPSATAPQAASLGPVTTGRSFGSDRVDGGQTVSLRMSLAPTTLEGQADAHGFTVTIRGALSLDRAATIARSNPAVDRASVLNRGDHAVLDVRFVEGRSPAYRVEIRGESVDITIGR
jgi:hypothetical protein